jgi:hypothetical protein
MKTIQARTKSGLAGVHKRQHGVNKARFNQDILFSTPPRTTVIQWPTEQMLQEVSKRLLRMNRLGIRWEADGDYFNSGDLAYQIQEIIRATDDLFKKAQRLKRPVE